MKIEPQIPMTAEAPRIDGQAQSQANGATTEASAPPTFPSGPLRDWLSARMKLSLPTWVIALAVLVLILMAID
jgi:hypothetical protein